MKDQELIFVAYQPFELIVTPQPLSNIQVQIPWDVRPEFALGRDNVVALRGRETSMQYKYKSRPQTLLVKPRADQLRSQTMQNRVEIAAMYWHKSGRFDPFVSPS
jgi:hypothetical protein